MVSLNSITLSNKYVSPPNDYIRCVTSDVLSLIEIVCIMDLLQ